MTNSIFIIGIGGASGCGKTFFANSIKSKLEGKGVSNIEIISCDNYYISYPNREKAPPEHNWDIPDSLDLDLLASHLSLLKKGNTVEIPKYNFVTSQREGVEKELDGSKIKIIIVEGLFVLFNEKLRSELDLKIFTLLDPDICLARRLQRDVAERGKSYKETLKQYQIHVKPSYVNYIEPTKRFADLIVSTSEFTDSTKSIDIIGLYVSSELKKDMKDVVMKRTSRKKRSHRRH
jgi:uridine kinase